MPRIILVLFILGSSICCQSQLTRQYLFSHFGVKEGLGEDNVVAVQQDAKGYIWIATPGMLQRYDGQRTLNFSHKDSDPRSLPPGNIKRMEIDQHNRIWILSAAASVGYVSADDFVYHAVNVRMPQGDYNKIALGLHGDQEGHIYLLFVGHALLTYNERANEFAEEYNPFRLPQGWRPLFIDQNGEHEFWIGTHEGLIHYNSRDKKMYYRGHNEEQDPVIHHFRDETTVVYAHRDKSGRFWLEGWPDNKLVVKTFTPATGEHKDWHDEISHALGNKYFEVANITETKDGLLWLSGNNLLANINSPNGNIEAIPNSGTGEYSILYDVIYGIFEDREKTLWVSTNKGVYLFNPSGQRFRILHNRYPGNTTTYSPDVTDFLETDDGELLVSTWGNAVFAYDKQFTPKRSPYTQLDALPQAGMCWSMAQRRNHDIWYGAQDGGLGVYHHSNKKLRALYPPVFGKSTIRQVAVDLDDNVWLGTQSGRLIKWDARADSFRLCQNFHAQITRVMVDSSNHVWTCTDQNGVYRMNTNGDLQASYTVNDEPSKRIRANGATDIIQYDDTTFVIASDGLNILNTRTNRFVYLTTETTLTSGNITSMVKDGQGYIWMATASGIESFHPRKAKISSYNAKDGVNNNSFNIGASALLRDGRVIFGTNHDALVFEPWKLTAIVYPAPRVEIAGFSVMNTALPVDSLRQLKQVELHNFEHSLIIELTTLTYQDRFNIYYIMEGLDKDWVDAGKLRQATFNYLRPGKYVFKTASMDENGKLGEITTLVIYIAPPFWKTWWFFCIIALLAGGLLFWLDRKRMQRKEAVQKMRATIASNLHEEVNTALSNINILSEMARLKADHEPQKSKEFIEQIHSRSHNMILSMNDMLWSISPENDSMNKAVERMQEYIDELNMQHDAKIEMQVDDNVKSLNLDMQWRHEAFLLFKEGIRSLVIAGVREPQIHVSFEKTHLHYRIRFNTQHCDIQQLNNLLQRQDMARRLESIRAKLDVQLNKSNSVFELRVPV